MFDLTLQPIGFNAEVRDEVLVVSIGVGMTLPISPGPDQPPIVAPTGQVQFPMNKQSAEMLALSITKAVEQMPDPKHESDLVVANSLSGVEQAAKLAQNLKGDR